MPDYHKAFKNMVSLLHGNTMEFDRNSAIQLILDEPLSIKSLKHIADFTNALSIDIADDIEIIPSSAEESKIYLYSTQIRKMGLKNMAAIIIENAQQCDISHIQAVTIREQAIFTKPKFNKMEKFKRASLKTKVIKKKITDVSNYTKKSLTKNN